MICSHCGKDGKGLVSETRAHRGKIYRRRCCDCGKSYITVESAPKGQKMPAEVNGGPARGQHIRDRRMKPEVKFKHASNDVFKVWE